MRVCPPEALNVNWPKGAINHAMPRVGFCRLMIFRIRNHTLIVHERALGVAVGWKSDGCEKAQTNVLSVGIKEFLPGRSYCTVLAESEEMPCAGKL